MTLAKAPAAPWHRVEWRVQGKVDGGGGVRVVPYLDRPTVADLLDDWVGPLGWRDFFEPTGKQGVMWCHLEIRDDEHGEWVRKTDVGTASDKESDKGLVSDAFKRVAMGQWGIGRNVYDLPTLRLTAGKFRTYKDSKGNDQAQLTDDSLTEIVRLLRAQGFAGAAETVRVEREEPAPAQPARQDDAEHARIMSELGALLPSLPDDKREAAREHATKGAAQARQALERAKQIIAAQAPDEPAPDTAPFDAVSDEVLSDLLFELGQLKEGDRKKETARLLGESSVESLDELPDREARKAQERLTKKRAEREAKEAQEAVA